MSKLTKLVDNPRLFWRDMLKKRGLVHDFPRTRADNLFILSHLGQLVQIQSLIRFQGLRNNYLVVLSTPANRSVPRAILAQVDRGLFVDVRECVLPRSPNEIDIGKLRRIAALYRDLLASTTANSLYMLSFERHYAVLATLARQASYRVNLVEEGTATYKLADDGTNMAAVVPSKQAKTRLVSGLIAVLPFLATIRPALSHVKEFDQAFVAFPRLLGSAFSIGRKERFFLHAGGMTTSARAHELVAKYSIGREDIIYVNQRYPVEAGLFAATICEILTTIAERLGARVFVKFHPKDSPAVISNFETAIAAHPGSADRIVIICEADFLIEPAISIAQPYAVLGLASTALVYAPQVSPDTAVYSCGAWFVSRVRVASSAGADEDGCALIEDHLKIVKRFPHVVDLTDIHALTAAIGSDGASGQEGNVRISDLSRMIADGHWQEIAEAQAAAGAAASSTLVWDIHRFKANIEMRGTEAALELAKDNDDPVYACACQALISAHACDDAAVLRHVKEAENIAPRQTWGELRLWQLKSAALRRMGRISEAEDALYALEPGFEDDPLWLLEMSRTAAANEHWEKALCYLGWAFPTPVDGMPEYAARERLELLRRLGRREEVKTLCLQWGRSGRSVAFAEEAIAITRGDILDALSSAQLSKALNLYDGGQELLRINGLPRTVLAYEAAMLREAEGDSEGAVASLGTIMSFAQDESLVLAAAALALQCHAMAGNVAAATHMVDEVTRLGIAPADQALLGAWLSAANGDWEEVATRLEGKIAETHAFASLHYRATLLFAEANRRLRRFENARAILLRLERKGYSDIPLRWEVMRLAGEEERWSVVKNHVTYLYADRIEQMPLDLAIHFLNATEASEAPQKAHQVACSLRAIHPAEERFVRAELEMAMQTGDRASIVAALEHGKHLESMHMWTRVRAMRALGNVAGAYRLLRFSEMAPPCSVNDWLLLAEVCYLHGDLAEAEHGYACAIRCHPTEVPASTLDRMIAIQTVLALRSGKEELESGDRTIAPILPDRYLTRSVSESN
ncbi:alpha-2,8-polysialyltransferase family protein [Cupriavidus sp. DF5525]|uniref:alpha-2,8-polysialyltransferase family protein n=1 Tax=Cupriavidus sp. DF5525 TaxID=3160989 RepID=UPI0003B0AFCA|nr:hypothetical protein N234_26975 [Ralstonia pickettii DTP0602]